MVDCDLFFVPGYVVRLDQRLWRLLWFLGLLWFSSFGWLDMDSQVVVENAALQQQEHCRHRPQHNDFLPAGRYIPRCRCRCGVVLGV